MSSAVVKSILLLSALLGVAVGDSCVKPEVSPKVFVSAESVLGSQAVVVAEFSVKCSNKPQGLVWHAELDGEVVPVSQSIDGQTYQVTLIRDIKKMSAGLYEVQFYDEPAAALLRKDRASAKSTFTLNVDYQGASRGLIVPSEVVALGGGVAFSMLAFHARSQLSS